MWCLACEQFSSMVVCGACRGGLEAGPDTVTNSGLVVRPAFVHEGPARSLVTKLKYQGLSRVADLFAAELVNRLPAQTRVLVPIPRVLVRKVKYGSDPGVLLAKALGRQAGIPVADILLVPVWARKSAGRSLEGRENRSFLAKQAVSGWLLVDDVVTSGGTLSAAGRALAPGGLGAVTATVALRQ